MPTLTSRQIFVWSLPALFLLSFLWFKRKKGALRSDPGGTDSKPKVGAKNSSDTKERAIPANAVKEVIKTEDSNSVEYTSVVTAQLVEDVLVAESSASVTADNEDCIAIAETAEEKTCKEFIASTAEAVPFVDKPEREDISAEFISEVEEDSAVEIIVGAKETSEIEDSVLADLISIAQENISLQDFDDNLISDIEDNNLVGINSEAKEILVNSASTLNPALTDLVQTNYIVADLDTSNQSQTLEDFNTDKIALYSDLECVDKISKADLIAEILVIPIAASIVSTANTSGNQVSFATEEEEAEAKVTQVDKGESVKVESTDNPALNKSWAEECELETEEKEEIMAREVSSDIILEVNSNIILEGTTIDDSGDSLQVEVASLESKLSSIEIRDAVVNVNGPADRAAVLKEGHGIERDSANHSPAEVMLGSPSLSNYSDSQSEGSSDSGKGCSDVVTPPSRTPASGSSVSGDLPVTSVYEFVLPQYLVGRLIGRHGQTVHSIKVKTHTNIIIKRHPDTTKVKICSIEGTPMDVESALELIRAKFPLKRYPNVTLDQVSFVASSTCPMMADNFQLQLVEGVNNDVILSSLVSPAHFFLQQPTHPTYPSLNRLNMCMNYCYNEPAAPALPTPIAASVICVAPTMGGWYRAQVIASDPASDSSYVKFIDYGGYQTVENALLRQIRSDFIVLPFQAAECYLANVKPVGGVWSCEAMTVVEELTQGQVIQAQIHGYAEDGVPVVYLFSIQGTQVLVVNRELVLRGYAEWDEPTEEAEPAAEIAA